MAGAALEARYNQKVARGCRKTCNRNVLRAFEKVNRLFYLREEEVMIECARGAVTILIVTWSPVLARCEFCAQSRLALWRGGHFGS